MDTAAESGFGKMLIFTGDALKYETHPEIAKEGAWTKAELKAQLDAAESQLEAKTARWEELEASIAEIQES